MIVMYIGGGIVYIILDVLIGVAAEKRGRSKIGWFLLSFFSTPAVAGVVLLVLGGDGKNNKVKTYSIERKQAR
ncbi:MAG: hypothetical protein IKT95_03785, partial [Spirochaetales bacterium]|nr:hypothetical protein [Spirochaetales bacterium]